MLMELPLDDKEPYSGLFEQVNQFNFEVIKQGSGTAGGGLSQAPDDSPNWNCFYQVSRDFEELLRFQGEDTYFEELTLQNAEATNGENGSALTTLRTWIYREHLSSTKGAVCMQGDGSIKGRPLNRFMPD